jgi:excisionase family DNA binding protein
MRSADTIALGIDNAAARIGVGRDKIFDAIRDRRLEAKKFGRRTLVTVDALRRFIDELPARTPKRATVVR